MHGQTACASEIECASEIANASEIVSVSEIASASGNVRVRVKRACGGWAYITLIIESCTTHTWSPLLRVRLKFAFVRGRYTKTMEARQFHQQATNGK